MNVLVWIEMFVGLLVSAAARATNTVPGLVADLLLAGVEQRRQPHALKGNSG
jgi:hypothetical protein